MQDRIVLPEGEKIVDFARRHRKSAVWVRRLILTGAIPATLIEPPATPVPYYLIPPGTPWPTAKRTGRPRKKSG